MAMTARRHRRAVHLVRRLPLLFDEAETFAQEPERVVGSHRPELWAAPGATVELGVDLPVGAQLSRLVKVRFGPLLEEEGVLALPVWWQDSDHPHLFPTFDGALEVSGNSGGTELRLIGSYEPPLRSLGRFADSLVGHRLVMASLERFVDEVAARLSRR